MPTCVTFLKIVFGIISHRQRNLPSSFLESEKFVSSRRFQDSASNDCNFLKKCVDSIFFRDGLL